MKKIFTLVLALVLGAGAAHAQTSNWTGFVSDDWNVSGNWDNGVPDNFTGAVIPVTTSHRYPVVRNISRSCMALTVEAPSSTDIPALTINAGNDLTVKGELVIEKSTTYGGAQLINNGTLKLTSNLTNDGTITSGSNSLLEFVDDGLDNLNPIVITGSGNTNLNDVTFSPYTTTEITTTNQVKIARVAKVQVFNVAADGHVRFTSNATSTGMLVNLFNAKMTGSVSVERFINTSYNTGAGYRHYSTPVKDPTFASMAVAANASATPPIVGFSPVINTSYAYPGSTSFSTFPNIFYYDESLVPTTVPANTYCTPSAQCPNCPNLTAFEYGWRCPSTSTLQTTRGYTVQIDASSKVVLNGVPNTGNYSTAALGRGGNATSSGWHLVGNPYPSPLNAYDMMSDNRYNATSNPNGFDATVYFFRSEPPTPASSCGPARINNGRYQFINTTTQQTGHYDNNGNPVYDTLQTNTFPVMQGFFVRKTTSTATKAFVFKNAHRLTTYQPTVGRVAPFYRAAAGSPAPATKKSRFAPLAPTLHVKLSDEYTGQRDYAQVTFRPDAVSGHDALYDAVRPGDNVNFPTIFTTNDDDELCALNTLPARAGVTLVPVGLHTLEAGHQYTIGVAKNELAPGTRVFLADQETGKVLDLNQQTNYTFTAQATSYERRFVLRFELTDEAVQPLAEAAIISTYPNPAQVGTPLEFQAKAVKGTTAQATLLDTFGRVVATQEVQVREGAVIGQLGTTAVKPGIYILRLNTAGTVTTQRIQIR